MSARRGRRARHAESEADSHASVAPPGAIGGQFRPLAEKEAHQVHDAALDLLENLGLSQAIPSMVDKVVASGGKLGSDNRLRFPRELVRWAIDGARRDLVLHGRQEGLELDVSGARVHMSSGGAAPGGGRSRHRTLS